jgi:polysaccharide export outer membrane protein
MTVPSKRIHRLALLGLCVLSACNSYPDKRLLQYLNTDGFGKRYTGNAEEENYVTIGDSVEIFDSFNPEELNGRVDVDIDGTVLLPEIGAVHLAGLTRTEIEAILMEKYSPYYPMLDIKVRMKTKGKKYFIFGEVGNEGEQPFEGDLTVFEAVRKASPLLSSANLGRVQLIKADPNDPFIAYIDIEEMMVGDSTFNMKVQELDIIFVPPTVFAQFGYFLENLVFPIKQVVSGLGNALFLVGGGGGGRGMRRNGNAQGGVF